MATEVTAHVKYIDGLQFVGSSESGHAIVMDGPVKSGGHDSGMSPMELLLVAIGGCTGMDVASVLRKKKQPFTSLEVITHGTKSEHDPMWFKEVTIEYVIRGKGVSETAVKRAIDLSFEKYCSVKATFENSSKVGFSYRIED